MSEENPNAFKLWINADVVKKYFKHTKLSKNEIDKIIKSLNSRELRARVQLIAEELKKNLSSEYLKALKELLDISKKENLKSFELWPATEFIQLYGLNHIDQSIAAMYELTQKFTAEFCIRPFINKYGSEIYNRLDVFKLDENEHIRRWLSEGTRPRLPWGQKLQNAVVDPSLGLALLEHLKFDSSLYVRKSVANHLNDIAKDHPEIVVKTLKRWKKQIPLNFEKEFHFISSRALRTLIKNGHPEAMNFAGVDVDQKLLKCSVLKVEKAHLKINDRLKFQCKLTNLSTKRVKFIVDYVIYFKKANAKLSPKVFKFKTGFLNAGEHLILSKQHHFKMITTRKYYAGEHRLALKVNGHELKFIRFDLKV